MTIEDQFKFDLHNGEEIDDMTRHNSYYLKINDDNSQTILFENGNQYKISSEGNVTERIDSEDEFLIDKQITNAIKKYIDSNSILTENYNYESSIYEDNIEYYRISKDEKKERSVLTRVIINRNSKNISIPNIMIPFELKYNGIGKEILHLIFEIARKHKYRVFLVQLVESFYNKMVERGAEVIEPYDIVEITENTRLK